MGLMWSSFRGTASPLETVGGLYLHTERLGFPPGWWSSGEGEEGLWVNDRLQPSAPLRWLVWQTEGTVDPHCWQARFDVTGQTGELTLPWGSGGSADREVYIRGGAEVFDAWSDAAGPRPMLWSAWMRHAIATVLSAIGCDLCGRPFGERRPAAVGEDRRSWVCGDCAVRVRASAPGVYRRGAACPLCMATLPAGGRAYIGRQGAICVPCGERL